MKIVCALFALLIVSVPAIATDTMKMVYFDNFEPFSYREDGQMKGILIDVVDRIIGTGMGIPVSHEGYPWERAQAMVRTNDADAFISVPTPERKKYTVVSTVPVSAVSVALFVNPENSHRQDIERVKTVAELHAFTTVSYIGNGWVKKNLPEKDVYWVPTLDRALFLMSKNRYDVYIGGALSTGYHIKKLGYEKAIVQLPNLLETTSLNLCIGKSSAFTYLLPAFDTAMQVLQDGGELKKIQDRYR